MSKSDKQHRVDRRRLLMGLGSVTGFVALGARPARALVGGDRRLKLHNIHTGEALNTVYATPDGYDPGALGEINRVLRDFRTDEVYRIDPVLLDLVHDLSLRLDAAKAFDIISGYRSPTTNAKLAAASSGVAKKSYHMKGMAIDLALPGRDTRAIYAAAKAMHRGGAGLYVKSGFVHVDTGPVRAW